MKKIFITFILLLAVVFTIVGCGNRRLIDTTWSYEYAIVRLPNGEVVEGKVSGKWSDYGDGDMLQVEIDGKKYLTHSANVVLISED